jgi:hypothetical protein
MLVWLLEHKDPEKARVGGEVFMRIVVRAKDWAEARDLATRISPRKKNPASALRGVFKPRIPDA